MIERNQASNFCKREHEDASTCKLGSIASPRTVQVLERVDRKTTNFRSQHIGRGRKNCSTAILDPLLNINARIFVLRKFYMKNTFTVFIG